MPLYNTKDIEHIKEEMPIVKDEIQKIKLDTYDPTLKEINHVNLLIHEFIKKKKRIVYGGYAQNLLIKINNKDDQFYSELDTPDVEFYSPKPVEDLMELCDFLHNKGIKRINGQEGIHNETYKLFVNFNDYCDITYMSENVYNKIPTLDINGYKIADPLFMTIDVFRVFSDPMTSYWRVEKSFLRNDLLLKYFPLPENKTNKKINTLTKNLKSTDYALRFIRKNILRKLKSIIMVGYYAYNYYVKKSGLKNLLTAAPYYDVISINYENDIKFIYKNLKSKFGNNLKIKEFYIFSQFLGKSTKFYLNNELILNVFDHNFRCTVYITSKNKKLKIASFSTMIMMILASIFYNTVFENKVEKNNQTLILSNIIAARNFYLKKRNLTVMDVSPFKEFGYECIGETMEFQRLQFLEREKRKKSNKKIVFRYEPTGKKTKIPNFNFNNSSGNQIKRKKDLIINIF
jgi:hypothetical protein